MAPVVCLRLCISQMPHVWSAPDHIDRGGPIAYHIAELKNAHHLADLLAFLRLRKCWFGSVSTHALGKKDLEHSP